MKKIIFISTMFLILTLSVNFAFAKTAGENLDNFIATSKKQMRVLDKKIETYGEKIEKMTDKSKAKAKKQLADLKQDRIKLQKKLDTISKDAGEEWIEIKKYFKKTYAKVEKKVEQSIK